MKRTDELKEFRGLDESELRSKAASLREELMSLRFKNFGGQLEKTAQLDQLRKRIARVETVLAEQLRLNEQSQ